LLRVFPRCLMVDLSPDRNTECRPAGQPVCLVMAVFPGSTASFAVKLAGTFDRFELQRVHSADLVVPLFFR
ncbi:MAG: hypothetical protein ACK58T_01925, partial [Phycisphaerae bacterium]